MVLVLLEWIHEEVDFPGKRIWVGVLVFIQQLNSLFWVFERESCYLALNLRSFAPASQVLGL